jgi:hypothetical protein
MKLGESGEAFFVEECTEGDLSDVPNLATSPIPTSELTNYESNIRYFVKSLVLINKHVNNLFIARI